MAGGGDGGRTRPPVPPPIVETVFLLLKLHHYGIRGIANHVLKSYLTERKQSVSLNDITSTTLTIEYGVPQGSLLEPLLLLIYINDLPNSLVTTPRFFADDTALIITSNSTRILQEATKYKF